MTELVVVIRELISFFSQDKEGFLTIAFNGYGEFATVPPAYRNTINKKRRVNIGFGKANVDQIREAGKDSKYFYGVLNNYDERLFSGNCV